MKISRPESEDTPKPGHLDVIKLDNQWGQVIALDDTEYSIRLLADGSIVHVDPYSLALVKKHRRYIKVSDLAESPSSGFSQQMLQNVHWGPEQNEDPSWKGQVNVFGEYETTNFQS